MNITDKVEDSKWALFQLICVLNASSSVKVRTPLWPSLIYLKGSISTSFMWMASGPTTQLRSVITLKLQYDLFLKQALDQLTIVYTFWALVVKFTVSCFLTACCNQPARHSEQYHPGEENWLWSVWCSNGGLTEVLWHVRWVLTTRL